MSVTKRSLNNKPIDGRTKDRRDELTEAAASVFVKKGFHKTKVSDIVTEAGVAQGTFYLYFQTKTDILEQIVECCCQDIISRLSTFSAAKASITSVTELRETNVGFLAEIFQTLETKHQAAKLVLSECAGSEPAIDKHLTALKHCLVGMIKENLKSGMAVGYIRDLNATIVAEGIVGMIYHIAFERFVRGRHLGVKIHQLAEDIIDFELRGIARF